MSDDTPEKSNDNDHLRISKLVFSSGPKSDESNYDVDCSNVVIFVGPNNSGKSASLREINEFCLGGQEKMSIISQIKFNSPLSDKGIQELLTEFRVKEIPPNYTEEGSNILVSIPDFLGEGKAPQYVKFDTDFIKEQLTRELIDKSNMGNNIIRFFTILLTGERRFELLKNKLRGDLKITSSNPLANIFRNVEIRNKIDKIIYDEFKWHLYLDHTLPQGYLEITFNTIDFPKWKLDDESSIEFFRKCLSIKNMGDGIRVFTGLLIAGMSLPHKIILIDEPEAFLHPPKARSLGTHLTSLIEERKASLIVSTHSPEFVLGCLDESINITIIRLTYDGKNATTRHLDSNQVLQLTTDPLLRTTETFNALFHDSAVVTEYHGDRVFYKEIFDKLKKQNMKKNVSSESCEDAVNVNDSIFLNTNGKHSMHRIFGPLRKIGIPTAAIYDLDIIKNQSMENEHKTLWKTVLKHANVPDSDMERLESERATLENDLEAVKESKSIPFKRKGLTRLTELKKQKGEQLLSELQRYGIFVVPIGELESWSEDITAEEFDKPYWLENILLKIDTIGNVVLSERKIWTFMKEVNAWLTNSDRLGMFSETKNISEKNKD